MSVKQAMLHDLGSRDTVFMNIVAHIRTKLLELAGWPPPLVTIRLAGSFSDVSAENYAAVLLQGSGTYAVEATFSTTVARQDAKVGQTLVLPRLPDSSRF